MYDLHRGMHDHLLSLRAHPPAEVYVFKIEKEGFVKPTDFSQKLFWHREQSAAHPVALKGIVLYPMLGLRREYMVKPNPSQKIVLQARVLAVRKA